MQGGRRLGRRCVAALCAAVVAAPALVLPSVHPAAAAPNFPAVLNVVFDGSGTAIYDHLGNGNGDHYHQQVNAVWHVVWQLVLGDPAGTSYPTGGTTVTGTSTVKNIPGLPSCAGPIAPLATAERSTRLGLVGGVGTDTLHMWADTFGGPMYHVCGGSTADPDEILPGTQTQGPYPTDTDAGGFVKFDISLPEWETIPAPDRTIDVSYTRKSTLPTQYGMVSCNSCRITLSASLASPAPKPLKSPDKSHAYTDLVFDAIPLAQVYCLPYGIYVSVFLAGAGVLGAGPVGPLLTISGALGALAAQPFCLAVIKRISSDIVRINDPPDNDYNSLAIVAQPAPVSLPPCTTYPSSGTAFCAELRIALTNYVVAEENIAAIDDALVTSVNRLNTAEAANAQAAVTTQQEAVTSFEQQMTAAVAQEHSYGANYVQVLRSKGITFNLNAAAAAKDVTYFQQSLQKAGVDPGSVTKIDPQAFASKATDVLALTSGSSQPAGGPSTATLAVPHRKGGGGLGGGAIALIVVLVLLVVGGGTTVAVRSRRAHTTSTDP